MPTAERKETKSGKRGMSVHSLNPARQQPGRYDHLVRPDGLVHRTLYTDPAIFDEEMRKIFGGSWVYLAHESELPNPHDFKTTTMGRRPVIVARDGQGALHGLLNRCTHRGSLVCVKEQGNAPRFQCPYHNWTFGSDGKLLAVTFPDGFAASFDKKARNLGQLPRLESYRGFIFGSLNSEVEPVAQWLGNAKPVLDWAIDKDEAVSRRWRVVKGTHYTFRANWKHQNDNNCDPYHVPFLHSSTAKMNEVMHGAGKGLDHVKGDRNQMYVQYLGNGHKLFDQRPEMGNSWPRVRPIPGKETHAAAILAEAGEAMGAKYLELVGRAGINLIIYPNLFIMGHGMFAVYEPVSVTRTNTRYYSTLFDDAPAAFNTLRLRFAEDFNNLAGRDDNDAMERIQDALDTIPEMEWLDFSRGLGTARESADDNGVITGNVMDDTGVRGSYLRWKELMHAEPQLGVVT